MDTVLHLDDFRPLPDAPALPGLRFRRCRGEVDYPAMLAVLNACRRADQISGDDTIARVTRRYPPQSTAIVLAEINGTVIGLCRWQWVCLRDDTQRYVHPNWRGDGIRRSLLHYCEAMLRAMATLHQHAQLYPAQSRRVLAFLPAIQDSEVTLAELLGHAGHRPVRSFDEMVHPTLDALPAARVPPGLEVRQVQADQYHAIVCAVLCIPLKSNFKHL
ncbi:MAG: GNAT family N-acetyltransferase [Chloroflexales bacterium]|nr:GNAT family N-acetyltransferase [Chloroflexales bacterium]